MVRLLIMLTLIPRISICQDTTCNNIAEKTDRFTDKKVTAFVTEIRIGDSSQNQATIYAWCTKRNGIMNNPIFAISVCDKELIGVREAGRVILLFSDNSKETENNELNFNLDGTFTFSFMKGAAVTDPNSAKKLKKLLSKRIIAIRLEGISKTHDIDLTKKETDELMQDLNCLYDKWL